MTAVVATIAQELFLYDRNEHQTTFFRWLLTRYSTFKDKVDHKFDTRTNITNARLKLACSKEISLQMKPE